MLTRSRAAAILTFISVTTVLAVALWGWSLHPEKLGSWVVMATILPVLWGYVEVMQVRGPLPDVGRGIMTFHRRIIGWAGLTMALRVASGLALAGELIDRSWALMGIRTAGVSVGLFLVYFGNNLPKIRSPWTLEAEPFHWQRVHRFAGWVCLLGGAATTAIWLFLPLRQAHDLARVVVLVVAVLTLARKLFSLATHDPGRVPSGAP